MPSRKVVALGLVALAAMGFLIASHKSSADYVCPDCNVILISLDTLRTDHLGGYGYHLNTSPNIDEFTGKGIVFSNAIATSPWTTPSHASLFTSLNPSDVDMVVFLKHDKLPDNATTLAEILSDKGYATAGFTGGGLVGPYYNLHQGFDTYKSNGRRWEHNSKQLYHWLTQNKDKKFFLFVHAYNCHFPYTPPGRYNKMFTNGSGDVKRIRSSLPRIFSKKGSLPDNYQKELEYLISQYDGEIAHLDDLVGKFLYALSEYGLLENTVIVITSDHGEEFMEHGNLEHAKQLYDESTRIPLIIYSPKLPRGKTVAEQVRITDIMPTLLDLVGVERPQGLRGVSLIPHIYGRGEDLPAFSENGRVKDKYSHFIGHINYSYYLASIRSDNLKLIYNETFIGDETTRGYFLYDLIEDPLEQKNVFEERVHVVSWLKNKLDESIPHTTIHSNKTEAPLDDKTIKELKGLGYIK